MPIMRFEPLNPFGVEALGFSGRVEDASLIRDRLLRDSLVLIRDAKIETDEELLAFAERLSFRDGGLKDRVLHWDFGPVMKMAFDPEAKNYLFSAEAVPFHWDGAFHVEPLFLVFSCLQSEGSGGETLFTNTERIWQSLDEPLCSSLERVRLTYRTEKKAHYGGQINIPLVQRHPRKGSTVLRFAEEVQTRLNPVERSVEGVDLDTREVTDQLTRKIYQSEFCYSHEWRAGDLLIVDNFSAIHGRRPLGENRSRAFKRVQVL